MKKKYLTKNDLYNHLSNIKENLINRISGVLIFILCLILLIMFMVIDESIITKSAIIIGNLFMSTIVFCGIIYGYLIMVGVGDLE